MCDIVIQRLRPFVGPGAVRGVLIRREVLRGRIAATDFVAHSALVETVESVEAVLAEGQAAISPAGTRIGFYSIARSRCAHQPDERQADEDDHGTADLPQLGAGCWVRYAGRAVGAFN